MNSNRIVLFLICIGLAAGVAGIASWSIMKPTTEWLQNGYAACLWSSTYRVPPEFVPDRSEIGASGQKLMFINPEWDPNHASCGSKPSKRLPKFDSIKIRHKREDLSAMTMSPQTISIVPPIKIVGRWTLNRSAKQ